MISPITINSKVERRSFFKLIYDYHSGNAPNTLDRAIEKINLEIDEYDLFTKDQNKGEAFRKI